MRQTRLCQEDKMRFKLPSSQKSRSVTELSTHAASCRLTAAQPSPAGTAGVCILAPGSAGSFPTPRHGPGGPRHTPGTSRCSPGSDAGRRVSVPAEGAGTGERGGAAVSAGHQPAAGGLQPGGARHQRSLPQAGQHHQSLRGHGEPRPAGFEGRGRMGQLMGELLSASLPQFPHWPHRRVAEDSLSGGWRSGAGAMGSWWSPEPWRDSRGHGDSEETRGAGVQGAPVPPLTAGLSLFSNGAGDRERHPQERGEG